MLSVTVKELITEYIFTATDGTEENTFEYPFGKEPPIENLKSGKQQALALYLAECKRNAELLAQYEIDKKAPPQEIVL